MVFSSLFFLFFFLPLNLIFYYGSKTTTSQNVVMLVFSLVFYAWGEPKYVILLVLMSLADWAMALVIERNRAHILAKLALFGACFVSLGLLGIFKYGGFIVENFNRLTGGESVFNVSLPIGISFYTFQLLTYVIDVYRGDVHAEAKYTGVLLYASLFHQCVAGPIVRYKDIAAEIRRRRITQADIGMGIQRFAAGLGKKALLANACGSMADELLISDVAAGNLSAIADNLKLLSGRPAFALWLGMAFYTLQIYLDFSAYSDMAIGMGLMTGFHYKENFDYPYCSSSVTEFWRRWHISLGSFFRDYVYIPLGGNRKGKYRTVFNTFVVWALTGFWHGASWNFLLWGLYYFVLLMLEKFILYDKLNKLPNPVRHLLTILAVYFGWVLFKFERMPLVGTVLKGMFFLNGNGFSSFEVGLMFKSHIFLLLISIVACLPVSRLAKSFTNSLYKRGKVCKACSVTLRTAYPCAMLILSTAALVGNSYNPFLYFQF